jgi:hypothetical protein
MGERVMQAVMFILNQVVHSLILVVLLVIQEPPTVGRVLVSPDTSKVDMSLSTGRLFQCAGIPQEKAWK